MRLQRHPYEDLNLVSRLRQDRRFALDFLDTVLRAGEGSEIVLAFTRVAFALDGVALAPETIDPDEARVVLERIQSLLKSEAREIVLA